MSYLDEYRKWCASDALSRAEKAELAGISDDAKEIEERFYCELEFGTAGLRGILRQGTNGMNVHVVRRATQGLADYMKPLAGAAEKGVCIAYDSRNFSEQFAREAACVLAANGIRVRLFSTLHSVPQLSFAIRHQGCMAGIVITASHNPAKYNGYKVYWDYGGQVGPEQASAIYECIRAVPYFAAGTADYDEAVRDGRIGLIGEEEDEAYYRVTESVALCPELLKKEGGRLKVVYTPLHGTGAVPVVRVLKDVGIGNVIGVPEQMAPDGNFPTVKAPNPESPDAFTLAKKLADGVGATIILASDPDADRLGIAVRASEGEWIVLTGNQIACVLLEHILEERRKTGTLPDNAAVVKSIVSTSLADEIARRNGVELVNVLTGFRYISEKIDEYERTGEKTFLFGFEESYGFLAGGFSRDKDAICSAMLAAEAAVCYAQRGMTLYDGLREIYAKYGFYKEKVTSYTLEGKEGLERIAACMKDLRREPLTSFCGIGVEAAEDYSADRRVLSDGGTEQIGLPRSNVLRYVLDTGDWIVIRPSGTEPKLKLYIGGNAKTEEQLDRKADELFRFCDGMLSKELGI